MLASTLLTTARSPINFLSGTSLTNQTSDATRTLTLNTGFISGHMLVAMTANRTTTAPTLLSGYTNILVINSAYSRSIRLQYKFATSTSETVSWTGAYGYLIALENSYRIGSTNTTDSSAVSNTVPLPDLSGLDISGNSYILAGAFGTSDISSTVSPYTVRGGYAVNIIKNTSSTQNSKSVTYTSTLRNVAYAVEFRTS